MVTKAGLPLIEVHISNPHAREHVPSHQRHLRCRDGCDRGFGFDSYVLALAAIGRLPARRSVAAG